MTPISECLPPSRINLNLEESSDLEAVDAVLSHFKGDSDVLDFPALEAAVRTRNAARLPGSPILIAHGRTEGVRKFVLGAGRLAPDPATTMPLRLVFVAGIPTAMNSDYLRTVGAIARICSHPPHLAELLEAPTKAEFIACLEAAEKSF